MMTWLLFALSLCVVGFFNFEIPHQSVKINEPPTAETIDGSNNPKPVRRFKMAAETIARREQHRLSHTLTYRAWQGMRDRCYNPACKSYADYGGRGIAVCDHWREAFTHFLSDMGPKPGPGYSVDRINENGNYEPGNCRWATRSQQGEHRRSNRMYTFDGETLHLAEWCRRRQVGLQVVLKRLNRGEAIESALSNAPRKKCHDLTGHTYGRWTVVEQREHYSGELAWLCTCECGEQKVIRARSLRCGHSKSCGCLCKQKRVEVK